MGYDEDECVQCYSGNNGNNPETIKMHTCFICIEETLQSGFIGRMFELGRDCIIPSGTCFLCNKERKCLMNLSYCERCCNSQRIKHGQFCFNFPTIHIVDDDPSYGTDFYKFA